MNRIFSATYKKQLVEDLVHWYAPVVVGSRIGKGRVKRDKRASTARRTADKFFQAAEEGYPIERLEDAVESVGSLLYPMLWRLLRPLLWRVVSEIVEWLWKRTR